MIVCLCRGITDREISDAVQGGASCVEEVGRSCSGAGQVCGTCSQTIEEILAACRTDRAA